MSAELRLDDAASRGDGRNPFSVAVMREALRSLRRPSSPRTEAPDKADNATGTHRAGPIDEPEVPGDCLSCGPVQPTHYYVRYQPTDPDQLADLADAGLELSFEPLDETVAANTPPADPTAAQIPWLYTAVPTDVPLPANVHNIPQERIAELFLFNPEDGDAADDHDPWDPQPEPDYPPCVPQWNPSCRCYEQPCEQQRTVVGKPRRNRIREATEQLKKAGISPLALYNEAMRLTRHADELLQAPGEEMGSVQARYNPSGTVLVEERTSRGTGRGAVPLRGATVFARRWFNLFANNQTNQDGQFYITRNFRKKARVIVEFKNPRLTTRGISPAMAPWGLVLPIRHELGLYDRTQMENLRYTFSYQSDVSSKGALSWTAATLFNSVDDMYASCAAAGIPSPPAALNVMLFSDLGSSASAPMLRWLTESSLVSQVIDQNITPLGQAVKRIVQRQLPDITCKFAADKQTRRTDDLDETFFHELGHSVHYRQAGNLYWTSYIGLIVEAAVKKKFDTSRSSIYGRKTDDGAGLISVSEAWGKYIGNTFTARKYDGIDFNIARDNRIELENQTPNSNPDDDDSWIVYGMLYDMTDNTVEPPATGVTDNVNSYTTQQIFRGLQSDVTEVPQYQQRVLSQNNNRQLTEMNQLLTSYRW